MLRIQELSGVFSCHPNPWAWYRMGTSQASESNAEPSRKAASANGPRRNAQETGPVSLARPPDPTPGLAAPAA